MTFALLLASRWLAHRFDDAGVGSMALRNNISEFTELNMYYLIMLYVLDVAVRRQTQEPRPTI